jgi:hypothetical protein
MSVATTAGRTFNPPRPMAADLISAMPFLPRDVDSIWVRAATLRDEFYVAVESACRELKIAALVNKSVDFVYPSWVSIEAWLPTDAPSAAHRQFCTFYIEPVPYARFEFVVTIKHTQSGKEKTYGPGIPPSADQVGQWMRYILNKGPKPDMTLLRGEKKPWQLWRPKNTIERLGRDGLRTGGLAALIGGLVLLGPLAPVGFLAIIGGCVCLIISHRRQRVVVNAGRPLAEPRNLRLVDNWQTVGNGLGHQWQDVRERLFKRLGEGLEFEIKSRLENIWYLTADGKQERQQLVLTQGRGVVFCHIYPYGDDLYIGWEAYVNYGQWNERAVAVGFDKTLHAPAVINTVIPGVARVTEYDLIDLNSLTEWTHSRVVQVVKQIMAERRLDQEIDFKIVRGQRQSLVNNQEQPARKALFHR